ncbi:hypothetical protein SK355_04180 [Candidatus Fukatsuia symbiotica]|uniref:DUF2191 domain-containing protein n=1 Tax=Candidatus Fukatsuia symbiotica TaxID=1878942 RepID=A0A2U8I8G1_9GAMM|nr:hypothetical protein [Candidatus Fukatsuia symbiotica]AWK14254.1 hypothetical protein CCS41_06855 [Candidatus Fukatsuia symbiotica]MEA9444501.1 hypothetical protein [Candidatus Fukatsuia symbiotica]
MRTTVTIDDALYEKALEMSHIKASMAERMAGVRSAVRPESHLQNPAVSGQPMTPQRYLPAQALQHYPSSAGSQAAVDREISAQLNRKIARYGQEKIPGETLFYLLTRGGISGSSPVGLPSSDGRIHWKTGAERRMAR